MAAICPEARLTGLSLFWIKVLGAWQWERIVVAWCPWALKPVRTTVETEALGT